ncbi:hypothetical protein [Pseudomonas sp. PIC25]|uniref:hypothetical protein n=1 Tax=Pseudomonas sp. PIC25 TaxID=1958773 RepID=UPI00117B7B44|nr:hypothetical protein [Pseudomonas sp. PIC25]
MRDPKHNFTEKTRTKLMFRAGHVCSNPECRAPTSGAKEGDDEGVLNMGVAAHICAASPNGARFDPKMKPQQIAAYKNGVWLCNPCSIMIDRDEDAYPVALLHQWRQAAEKRSRSKLCKPALPDTAPQDLVATALYGAPLRTGIAQAIANAHGGVEKAMESIDNRFKVSSLYADGQTTFTLSARENVPLSLVLKNASAYAQAYRLLVDEGKTLVIKAEDIEASGSELFERIAADAKVLKIGNAGRPLTAKISTHDKVTGSVSPFDDMSGEFVYGRVRGTFTGYSMNKMLKLELSTDITFRGDLRMSITPNMEVWRGAPVTELPYYAKLRSLLRNLNEGHTLNITLEYQGEHGLSGGTEGSSFKGKFENAESLFLYVDAAREISRFTGQSILFDDTETIGGGEIEQLIDIASMARREYTKVANQVTWPIAFNIEFYDDAKKQAALLQAKESLDLQIVQAGGDVIQVFRQDVQMPPKVVRLLGVSQKITELEANNGEPNYMCEVFPKDEFSMEIFYRTTDDDIEEGR